MSLAGCLKECDVEGCPLMQNLEEVVAVTERTPWRRSTDQIQPVWPITQCCLGIIVEPPPKSAGTSFTASAVEAALAASVAFL